MNSQKLLITIFDDGGPKEDRTPDLLNANQALSQLSYGPVLTERVVGLGRLELPTPRLSSVCSNQLSYKPELYGLHQAKDPAGSCFIPEKKRYTGSSDDREDRKYAKHILRKEVIQPQVPLRLPCYDFTPVIDPTVVACLLAVSAAPSGRTNSHGVTGGVYKTRERIHRGVLIHDY